MEEVAAKAAKKKPKEEERTEKKPETDLDPQGPSPLDRPPLPSWIFTMGVWVPVEDARLRLLEAVKVLQPRVADLTEEDKTVLIEVTLAVVQGAQAFLALVKQEQKKPGQFSVVG
jgi:hypothetical protein